MKALASTVNLVSETEDSMTAIYSALRDRVVA
jgi:hypothetical protein